MDYYSDKHDFTSEHSFVPSRPPPARRPDLPSYVPSYYGLPRSRSSQDFGIAALLAVTRPSPAGEAAYLLIKKKRRRKIVGIGVLVAVLCLVAIVVGVVVGLKKHHHHAKSGTGKAMGDEAPSTILSTLPHQPVVASHAATYSSSAPTTTATTMKTHIISVRTSTTFVTVTPTPSTTYLISTQMSPITITDPHPTTPPKFQIAGKVADSRDQS